MARIEPAGPPEAYRTFQIKAPLATHFRPATCEEVGCEHYTHGWRLRWDILSEQDRHLATHCGRRYELIEVSEHEHWLVFQAGQPCFQSATHRAPIGRPELYIVREGDHRGNPRGIPARLHQSAGDWTEELHEQTDKLTEALERG